MVSIDSDHLGILVGQGQRIVQIAGDQLAVAGEAVISDQVHADIASEDRPKHLPQRSAAAADVDQSSTARMNRAESRSHGRIDSGLAAARAEAGAMLGCFAHNCGPTLINLP